MPDVLSKFLFENNYASIIDCEALCHPGQSCARAALTALRISLKNSLIIYGSLYTVRRYLKNNNFDFIFN